MKIRNDNFDWIDRILMALMAVMIAAFAWVMSRDSQRNEAIQAGVARWHLPDPASAKSEFQWIKPGAFNTFGDSDEIVMNLSDLRPLGISALDTNFFTLHLQKNGELLVRQSAHEIVVEDVFFAPVRYPIVYENFRVRMTNAPKEEITLGGSVISNSIAPLDSWTIQTNVEPCYCTNVLDGRSVTVSTNTMPSLDLHTLYTNAVRRVYEADRKVSDSINKKYSGDLMSLEEEWQNELDYYTGDLERSAAWAEIERLRRKMLEAGESP